MLFWAGTQSIKWAALGCEKASRFLSSGNQSLRFLYLRQVPGKTWKCRCPEGERALMGGQYVSRMKHGCGAFTWYVITSSATPLSAMQVLMDDEALTT